MTDWSHGYMYTKRLNFIGAAICHGQMKRGPEFAPELIRSSNLFQLIPMEVNDIGDIVNDELIMNRYSSSKIVSNQCKRVHDAIDFNDGAFNLIVGGDHSVAIGSISGIMDVYRNNLKVVWIDAHADINTPSSSISGNIHGQPLAYLMNHSRPCDFNEWMSDYILKPEQLIYIGLRDLDDYEMKTIKDLNIKAFFMDDINKHGLRYVLEHLNAIREPIHCSFDVDALCKSIMPCTGTPVACGLSKENALMIMRTLNNTGKLISMDIVELNPLIEPNNINDALQTVNEIIAAATKI